jgi:hypothetical protein
MMYDYFLHRVWKDFARHRKNEKLENSSHFSSKQKIRLGGQRQLRTLEVQLPLDPETPEKQPEEPLPEACDLLIEKFELPHLLIYQFNNLGSSHV